MSEYERLLNYHPFDDEVAETVAVVAYKQRNPIWETISSEFPDNIVFTPVSGKPVQVFDIGPKADNDGVQVYHVPMGNSMDENMRLRVATLSAAEPTKRVIAVGNPGPLGEGMGKLRHPDRKAVARGNLRATIEPTLEYLNHEHIGKITHIGYSYGADKAVTAAEYSDRYDIGVPMGLFMEPASVKQRGIFKLAKDFQSTEASLASYVDAANSEVLLEARRLAAKRGHGMIGYELGLARLTNIAIARALSKDGFESRVDAALETQNEMTSDILWGSESELAINSLMVAITDRLIVKYPGRVTRTVMEGQKHAMSDDIFLNTAMILQSLKRYSQD